MKKQNVLTDYNINNLHFDTKRKTPTMRQFKIEKPSEQMLGAIRDKIDNLNKPKGSLGQLEKLAEQICYIQQTLTPELNHPCHLLLGGDHGIEREGVSVSPRDVTWQQMINFTHGGGGVNMFCRQHGFDLRIVDMGVDYDLSCNKSIRNCKIANGTRNFLHESAMSLSEYDKAIETGCMLVDECAEDKDCKEGKGCNIICVGEMGIANTSPSSIWMSLFGNIPLDECIGVGAGLNNAGLLHKREILAKSVERFQKETPNPSVVDIIREFGGFEMVGAIGAMLRAAERKIIVMIDGFIMSACALAAVRLYPEARNYFVFGHCGDESGHKKMLALMDAEPLLHLGLRLGEGTGALCSYPIIESAVRMVNEMNNFENAKITKYF